MERGFHVLCAHRLTNFVCFILCYYICQQFYLKFYIFLTVHLSTIRVNNQLDALFLMYLFHFSTRFEQPSAHHQENQLYQYILLYISLCVSDRLVYRSPTCIPDGHLPRVIYTRWCIDTIRFSWWWALGSSKHVEKGNKQIHWKKYVKLVINKNYTEMHEINKNTRNWPMTS